MICYNVLSQVPGLNPVMPKGAMYMMVYYFTFVLYIIALEC